MTWNGSIIAENIWEIVKDYIPEEEKQNIAQKIVELFEQEDCDTIDDAEDLYETAYPESVMLEDGDDDDFED